MPPADTRSFASTSAGISIRSTRFSADAAAEDDGDGAGAGCDTPSASSAPDTVDVAKQRSVAVTRDNAQSSTSTTQSSRSPPPPPPFFPCSIQMSKGSGKTVSRGPMVWVRPRLWRSGHPGPFTKNSAHRSREAAGACCARVRSASWTERPTELRGATIE